jgi:hypothetical protein
MNSAVFSGNFAGKWVEYAVFFNWGSCRFLLLPVILSPLSPG